MTQPTRVAIYARYSSDLQREESITAQVRMAEAECERKGYIIVDQYLDKAKSARSDRRPEFQRMMTDARAGHFDVVMVHKLNRFSRNITDAYRYKTELKKLGVRLESIVEKIDDTPQGILLEALFFAMAENYSRELATEVLKGQKENAYQCRHTGGIPPLGFDVDPETKKLVLNEHEAQAVKLIFERYDEGCSYADISAMLNAKGYTTKRGRTFGKNSLHEILRNEKYIGNYVYNKKAAQDASGARNNHAQKDDSEIVRVAGGCPQIVSQALWDSVQQRLHSCVRTGGRNRAKENYLLSGLIYCGHCGRRMSGNRTTSGGGKKLYVGYRCENKTCDNPQLKKDWLENFVLKELERIVFSEAQIPFLLAKMKELQEQYKSDPTDTVPDLERQLKSVDQKINNIVNSIADGISKDYFGEKLTQLETEKTYLTQKLAEAKTASPSALLATVDEKVLRSLFRQYRQFISTHNLPECRKFISTYVRRVVVHKDNIEVELTLPTASEETNNTAALKMVTAVDPKALKVPQGKARQLRTGIQKQAQ